MYVYTTAYKTAVSAGGRLRCTRTTAVVSTRTEYDDDDDDDDDGKKIELSTNLHGMEIDAMLLLLPMTTASKGH